jgi:hypothetical protein
MRRFLPLVAAALAACGAPEHQNPFDPSTPVSQQARATVTGSIQLEAVNGVPSALDLVLVTVTGPRATVNAFTDPSGVWTTVEIPVGVYTISASKAGYHPAWVSGVTVTLDEGGTVMTLPPITLSVARGDLTGTVALDVSTVPGFGAMGDRSGTVVTLAAGGTTLESTVTDATGGYRFASVPAVGLYALSAQRPNFAPTFVSTVYATPLPDATLPGNDLSLSLVPGTLQGSVVLWDAVAGGGANATSDGARVSITGTTFNGQAWEPPPYTTPAGGTWSFAALPPGTYDVVVGSMGRTCGSASSQVVASGALVDAGAIRCTDAIAPGPVGLGQPLPTGGGISGWVSGASVTIPIAQAATDGTLPTANLRGYQIVVGAAPTWDAAALVSAAPIPPTQLTATGLAPNATNVVWVRAIDWTGNTGPATSVAVVQDSGDPTAPTITAPKVLSDQTATVVFTGADADPSFLRYEACTAAIPTTASCNVSPTCAFGAVSQSWPVALAANQQTCLWAQTVDKAGRTSTASLASIVNDTSSPAPPLFRPSYDPAAVTVRAEWVDFFLDTPSSDAAWGGTPWTGIAWIEVDTGSGFQPLCPASSCHPANAYNPCDPGCACGDARVRCVGTSFSGLRIPLASESVNSIAFRAVDLAGNAGNGLSQDVVTETGTGAVVAATNAYERIASIAGNSVTWTALSLGNTSSQVLLDLGTNRRPDASDPTCSIPNASNGVLASRSLLAYTQGGGLWLRRATGATFCVADSTTQITGAVPAGYIGASGERVAWAENTGTIAVKVREPGANGTLGDGDDTTTTMAGTYTINWWMQLAGNQLIADLYGASTGSQMVHRIFSAPNGFQGTVTTFDLSMGSVPAIALSPDGGMLAYVQGGVLHVRYPTAGRYGAGDIERTVNLPSGYGVGSSTNTTLAIDGTHVVLGDQNGGGFVHWDAGQDGAFASGAGADDALTIVKPSKAIRHGAGISRGLLVYDENSDVFLLDLTGMRWDDVPSAYNTNGATVDNASGSVLFGGFNWFGGSTLPLTAHCADGRDTTNGVMSNWFSGNGDYVVANTWGAGLYLHTRDIGGASPSGCFFTGSATTRLLWSTAQTPTYPGSPLHATVVGETVLVGNQPTGAPETRIFALEPAGAGTSLALAGADPTLLSTNIDYPYGLGLTAKQAVYYCGRQSPSTGYQVCVKGKGAGNLFKGAGAPAEQLLKHPSDAAIVADRGATLAGQHVKVSGNHLVVNTYGSGTLIVDAGADGLFNTADDHEITLVPYRIDGPDYAIAGNWIAYVDAGSPAGDQIFLYNLADRTVQQVTSHVSSKTNLSVDANGRVWWEDSVFGTTWSIWVRTP